MFMMFHDMTKCESTSFLCTSWCIDLSKDLIVLLTVYRWLSVWDWHPRYANTGSNRCTWILDRNNYNINIAAGRKGFRMLCAWFHHKNHTYRYILYVCTVHSQIKLLNPIDHVHYQQYVYHSGWLQGVTSNQSAVSSHPASFQSSAAADFWIKYQRTISEVIEKNKRN